MGAEQSAENKRKDDAKYQAMLKNALEQQRKAYEEKCKELLQEQLRIKAANEHVNTRATHNNITSIETQRNAAPLYPNLQQVSTVQTQASTASAFYHARLNKTSQNKSILDPVPKSLQFPQPVQPNFQQNVNTVPAASTSSNHSRPTNSIYQNKSPSIASFDCKPSAPVAPTAPEMSSKLQTVQQKQKPKPNPKKDDTHLCPTCKVHSLDSDIYQCQQGHSSCNKCKKKAAKCGICNATITNTRNIELERLLASLPNNNVNNSEKVHCPNKSDGCIRTLLPENLQAHLKDCLFREMECPISSAKYLQCSWRGKINQIPAHTLECHPNQAGANVDTEIIFNRAVNNYVIHHVVIGNFNFLVHIKLDCNLQTFFMAVQLIGSFSGASKWLYEFHVYEKSEPRRKFTYVDACLPNSIPFSELSKENKCAALPLHYALSFFKDNTVTYKFYIKKDESIKVRRRCGKNLPNSAQSDTQ